MRILSILKHTSLNGVGTWNYTFLKAIKESHPDSIIDIYFRCQEDNTILVRELRKFCNIFFHLPDNTYDITYTNFSESIYPKTKKIFHFVHNLMQDDFMNNNADIVFCFGERSFNFVKHNNKILIRNAVDLNRFKFQIPNDSCDRITLLNSRNNSFLNSKVLAAVSTINSFYNFIGEDLNNDVRNKWNVEEYIKKTDLLIGLGRSAIEGMAMGKNVIICDHLQLNGIVTPENFFEHAETNFTGWTNRKKLNFNSYILIKELLNYNKEYSYSNYELIKKHFDINTYIEKLLQ